MSRGVNANVEEWVARGSGVLDRDFREAVHVILLAMCNVTANGVELSLKGGVLLSIGFGADRYTTDIDFSYAGSADEFPAEDVAVTLDAALVEAAMTLGYDIECRRHGRIKKDPDRAGVTNPTYSYKVAYARKGTVLHRRLVAGRPMQTLDVEVAVNEPIIAPVLVSVTEASELATYSRTEFVAEKLRAILQQSIRNRGRGQDVYDLNVVFGGRLPEPDVRKEIHTCLLEKCKVRGLAVKRDSLNVGELRARAESDYRRLSAEVDGDLPAFNEAFDFVEELFASLPWEQ